MGTSYHRLCGPKKLAAVARGQTAMESPKTIIPTNWGESKNLKWKLKLPGPGASSPIIWGNQLFLRAIGYGVGKANGNLQSLIRRG